VISRSSFASSGHNGAARQPYVLGECKKNVLQRAGRQRGLSAQFVQCAGSANPAAGEQNQPVTDPLYIDQLMNGENERSAASGMVAEHVDDLARLPQIEAVEWLIHQQHRMRRQQSQHQQQSTVVPFRQRMHALVKNGS